MPDDELPDAAGVEDDGRVVARLPVGRERAPHLRAGVLVERDHLPVRLRAGEADQQIALDERRPGHPPRRHLGSQVGDIVLRPQDGAGGDFERKQPAHRSLHVDAVPVHGRRGARADGVQRLEPRVVGLPLAAPQRLAGLLVEAEHPLDHPHAASAGGARIDDEDPPAGHGRTRVAVMDGDTPGERQPAGRELLEDAGLGPDTLAPGAAVLRPVVGRDDAGHRDAEERRGQHQEPAVLEARRARGAFHGVRSPRAEPGNPALQGRGRR